MTTRFENSELELAYYYQFVKEKLYQKSKIKFFFFSAVIIFYLAVPGFQIPTLELTRTRISAVMEQRSLENFLIFFPLQDWVDYEEIPLQFKQAFFVMEDDGFVSHRGIDWESIQLAARVNLRRGKIVKGGSTITMQLAKNIYFSTRRHYFRKAKEILTAIRMEKELPKQTILEHYANVIELGDGIFGIGEASKKYFNKDVSKLAREHIARIVAVIPSPLRHSPVDNSRFVVRRKNIALSRMNSAILPD